MPIFVASAAQIDPIILVCVCGIVLVCEEVRLPFTPRMSPDCSPGLVQLGQVSLPGGVGWAEMPGHGQIR